MTIIGSNDLAAGNDIKSTCKILLNISHFQLVCPKFLAHFVLPKLAYIIMIHEMDPNTGS